jgi:signal transduction histidine kinase
VSKQERKKTKDAGSSTWHWYLFAGILVLLLAVLALSTGQYIRHGGELMQAHIEHQGEMMLSALQQATRAALRRGFFREQLLQSLAEEMMEDKKVRGVAIFDPSGGILALSRVKNNQLNQSPDPLEGLSPEIKRKIQAREKLVIFTKNELVVGRTFDPFRIRRRPLREMNRRNEHRQRMGAGRMGAGPMNRGGMMRNSELPPWLETLREKRSVTKMPYALVRISTKGMHLTKAKIMRGALLMAMLIFAAAAVAVWGMWAVARRRSREIESLRQEVAQAGHLAAVGRLAASVAHEVRNPLSALRGLVQFIGKDFDSGSEKAECATAAVEEVDRLERVVSGLLEYSRPKEPRFLPTDLAESIKSITSLLKDDPRADGIDITTEAPDGLPEVNADPDQIRQVLLNLVVNALEALNGRGYLLLRIKLHEGQALVQVCDNGPGLGDQDPEELFDPFFSTKERGTGLGLAIARRIARAHKGNLTAANQESGGCCFTLSIPLKATK